MRYTFPVTSDRWQAYIISFRVHAKLSVYHTYLGHFVWVLRASQQPLQPGKVVVKGLFVWVWGRIASPHN